MNSPYRVLENFCVASFSFTSASPVQSDDINKMR